MQEPSEQLLGTEWCLDSVLRGGDLVTVRHFDLTLRFDENADVLGSGTNSFWGRLALTPELLRVTGMGSTLVNDGTLRGEVERLVMDLLADGAHWTLTNGKLRVTGQHVVLHYQPGSGTNSHRVRRAHPRGGSRDT